MSTPVETTGMDAPRRMRKSSARTLEGRSMEGRAPIGYVRGVAFMFPQELIDAYPDKVFSWTRKSFGQAGEDRENFDRAIEESGFDLIPAAVCAEFMRVRSGGRGVRDNGEDGMLHRRGHVAMWRDRQDWEEEQAEYDEWTSRQRHSVEQCENSISHTIVDERSYSVPRGGM